MRISAPVLGAPVLIEFRVGIAALFLTVAAWTLGRPFPTRAHWRHYSVLGLVNSGLPFLLLAFAAQTLSASVLAILNATAPLFGALVGALWLRQRPPVPVIVGGVLGIFGVAILVGHEPFAASGVPPAVVAALGAAACYGVASVYATHAAPSLDPFANAHGSMWAATVLLALIVPWSAPTQAPTMGVALAVVALGLLCTGVAYLLYFRLVRDVGPTSALAVTFLIPVFGVLWGMLFLAEPVGWRTLVGAAVILAGTALIINTRTKRPVVATSR